MGLRMKIFNMGVHKKNNGGNFLKGKAWTVYRLEGGLEKREGGVFEGVDTPIHTMVTVKSKGGGGGL